MNPYFYVVLRIETPGEIRFRLLTLEDKIYSFEHPFCAKKVPRFESLEEAKEAIKKINPTGKEPNWIIFIKKCDLGFVTTVFECSVAQIYKRNL